jgi:NAD(P)-dependent dehydrogenase (short-subunit alcohol dehydrogenase family)
MQKTILLTGGTSGLGLRTTSRLVRDHAARVIITGRDRAQTAALARRIGAEPLALDLGSLASVAAAVEELASRGALPLDAVVANAGIQVTRPAHTADGFEQTFGVNHLGHVALLARLLAIDGVRAPGGRIVLVASGTHDPALRTGMPAPRPIDAHALAAPAPGDESITESRRRYTTSKLANVMTAYDLARRLQPLGIAVNAYDPGLMPGTGLARDAPRVQRLLFATVMRGLVLLPGATSPRASSRHLAALAVGPQFDGVTGTYRSIGAERSSSAASYDERVQRALWSDSLDLVGMGDAVPATLAA